jgi:hypothetical protein
LLETSHRLVLADEHTAHFIFDVLDPAVGLDDLVLKGFHDDEKGWRDFDMLEGARNLQSVLGVGLCVKKCKKWIFWGLGLARGGKVLDLSSHAKARSPEGRGFLCSRLWRVCDGSDSHT